MSSGGQIRADQTVFVGYTLEDTSSGETTLSPVVAVTTQQPYDPPASTPVATVDYLGGALLVDTYYYGVTLIDSDGGETPLGPYAIAEREPGFASGRITVSNLAADLGINDAVAWRLYRSVGGSSFDYLASGATSSYLDDGSANPNCTIHPPPDLDNTTNSTNTLLVTIPSGGIVGSGAFIHVYASEDGTFLNPAHLDVFPISSAGNAIPYRQINLQTGRPPDVSTTLQGASKIDPDQEILDWHWRRPVTNATQLGSGEGGDVRLAFDSMALYGLPSGFVASATSAASWKQLTMGSALWGLRGSGGSPRFEGLAELEVGGSGNIRVTLASGAGKRGILAIHGPTEDHITVSGSVGSVNVASGINLRGSGGTTFTVDESPTGSARITIIPGLAHPASGYLPRTVALDDIVQPNTARVVHVTAQVSITCNDDDDGRIYVQMDSSATPSNVVARTRLKRNNDAAAANEETTMEQTLSFLVPPGQRYQIKSETLANTPVFTLDSVKHLDL